MKHILIFLITIYRRLVSPYLARSCRFEPTCSHYMQEALLTHGLLSGLKLGIQRLLQCHPIKFLGGKEGFDPVPPKD